MQWMDITTLAGGNIGMEPFLVGFLLLIVFVIDLILVLVFRKRIRTLKHKLFALIIGFVIYELTIFILSGFRQIFLFDSFEKPLTENVEGAYSFSSIFAIMCIGILMMIISVFKIRKLIEKA